MSVSAVSKGGAGFVIPVEEPAPTTSHTNSAFPMAGY